MQRASGAETCESTFPLTARFLIQTPLVVLIRDDARVEKGRQQGCKAGVVDTWGRILSVVRDPRFVRHQDRPLRCSGYGRAGWSMKFRAIEIVNSWRRHRRCGVWVRAWI